MKFALELGNYFFSHKYLGDFSVDDHKTVPMPYSSCSAPS